jgi:ATP-dependent DNA helicase RecQ
MNQAVTPPPFSVARDYLGFLGSPIVIADHFTLRRFHSSMIELFQSFLDRCVSVDLEVNPASATVFALAAVKANGRPAIVARQPPIERALDLLEQELAGVEHVLGHNILRHDLPHLTALWPRVADVSKAPIDTLWLNPLAFPRNPYHHLVKHYHDGRLQAGHVNDPELDARLVFTMLRNQLVALEQQYVAQPDAVAAFHYLSTRMENAGGFDAVFREVRGSPVPTLSEVREAVARLLSGQTCEVALDRLLDTLASPSRGWPTAYALSWILVAGGDSVMPPWVRMQFPEAARIVRQLRDTGCELPGCVWCREQNDPVRALSHWFGFEGFRPQPVDDMGRPLQERIVDEAMRGRSILGILPTGTGKSVCYQIPALTKFDRPAR